MACRVLFLVHIDVKMERFAIVLKIYYRGSHITKSILIMNQLMTLVLSINTVKHVYSDHAYNEMTLLTKH